MASKRKIIRVFLFDPDATDSDSDSGSKNSQIKTKQTLIQTIEIPKSTPIRKPKTLIRNPKPSIPTNQKPNTPKSLPKMPKIPKTPKNKTLNQGSNSNSPKKQPSSQYKGVRRRQSGNWAAEIRDPIRGTRIWLGTFKSEQVAHQVYQAAFLQFEKEKENLKKQTQTTEKIYNKTETLIMPAVQSPKVIPDNKILKKDLKFETGNEIPVKSISSITTERDSLSSREESLSKGENEELLFPGFEIPDLDFRFEEGDLLMGDFTGEEDLIRLDDVPLWTENLESCDLSFLDA